MSEATFNAPVAPTGKIKIFENPHLVMWTPSPTAEGRRAKLSWGIRNGNPRLTVFTNDPADIGIGIINGVIPAPMDNVTLLALLNLLEKSAMSLEEIKHKISCSTLRWENGVQTKQKILLSEIWFGKDSEGLVWISLIAPNRPKIKFVFQVSDWHEIIKADGSTATPSEGSQIAAIATIQALRIAYSVALAEGFLGKGQAFKQESETNANVTDWSSEPTSDVNKPIDKTVFDDVF
jgi:hypothetical protein